MTSFLAWMALISGVLLLMALASSYVRDLPITTSAVYLALGVALGPLGAGLLALDVLAAAVYVERITEVAVIVALFVGGLKLRLPWRAPAWRAAFMLAGPVMIATVLGITAVAHLALGLAPGPALLLGAVLAPTDPVLASAVAVNDADDHDRMRCGLSGEAGLNDGTAFPFVVFGLAWITHDGPGTWIAGWALHRLVWAVPAGLALGFVLGTVVGRLAIAVRARHQDATAPSDLLALALIGVAYVGAEVIGAWGFLAVFAAGLGLRMAEIQVVSATPHPDADLELHAGPAGNEGPIIHPPAEAMVGARVGPAQMEEPAVAAGVLVSEALSFGDTIERLVEAGLLVAVGVALATHWDARAVPLAVMLFAVIRPLATRLALAVTPTTSAQRWLMGWFGIRGIGSLYYLGYALRHGGTGGPAREIVDLTISVIALSVVLHGITATPLLTRYERALDELD